MSTLPQLHADIDIRVQNIRDGATEWPCAKGCDRCCRQLADIPTLTRAEWELLHEGLAALPATLRDEVGQRVAALACSTERPITCPFLDQSTGACPVYAYRPVACRTYGFYVQRDRGLYCSEIDSRVASGDLALVVWGNHDVVDRRLAALGEARPLTEWFNEAGTGQPRGD